MLIELSITAFLDGENAVVADASKAIIETEGDENYVKCRMSRKYGNKRLARSPLIPVFDTDEELKKLKVGDILSVSDKYL